jgi:hypothetical protein
MELKREREISRSANMSEELRNLRNKKHREAYAMKKRQASNIENVNPEERKDDYDNVSINLSGMVILLW